MAEMLATLANMRRLAEGPLRVEGAELFAYSPRTFEKCSATPGDYWQMRDDDTLNDRLGQPMVLAYSHEKVTIVEDATPDDDDFSTAMAAVAAASRDGVMDDEAVAAATELLRVLHERYSEDGEGRGTPEAQQALDLALDRWDDFLRSMPVRGSRRG